MLLLGPSPACCAHFSVGPSCRRAALGPAGPGCCRASTGVFSNLTPRAAWDIWFLATQQRGLDSLPQLSVLSLFLVAVALFPQGSQRVWCFALNMWLLFYLFFFSFPVLGMEVRAVGGHPNNRSAMSPNPICLVSFNVRTCKLMLWHPMRESVSKVGPLL